MTATTERQDILADINRELTDINPAIPSRLPAGVPLKEELGVDSLDLIELVARLEYRFGFLVPEEDWQQLETLDAVATYVSTHRDR